MVTLFWIIASLVALALYLLFSVDLCPSCGLELTDSDLDRLERQVFGKKRRCPHCGTAIR